MPYLHSNTTVFLLWKGVKSAHLTTCFATCSRACGDHIHMGLSGSSAQRSHWQKMEPSPECSPHGTARRRMLHAATTALAHPSLRGSQCSAAAMKHSLARSGCSDAR